MVQYLRLRCGIEFLTSAEITKRFNVGGSITHGLIIDVPLQDNYTGVTNSGNIFNWNYPNELLQMLVK